MGKIMFGDLRDQLDFMDKMGLNPSIMRPHHLGLAFAQVQRAEEAGLADPIQAAREELLGTLPLLRADQQEG